MRDRIRKAVPLMIVVAFLFYMANKHYGQKQAERTSMQPLIPERFYSVRKGDWFSLIHDGETIRQVCTDVVVDRGKRLVRYRLEYLDGENKVARSEEREISKPESYADDVNKAAVKGQAKVDLIETEIGGKKVRLYRAALRTGMEIWFSDAFSVDGVVRVSKPGGISVKPVDFGRYDAASPEASDG